jgi:hypothetical protein
VSGGVSGGVMMDTKTSNEHEHMGKAELISTYIQPTSYTRTAHKHFLHEPCAACDEDVLRSVLLLCAAAAAHGASGGWVGAVVVVCVYWSV